jgi:hypothetical protein
MGDETAWVDPWPMLRAALEDRLNIDLPAALRAALDLPAADIAAALDRAGEARVGGPRPVSVEEVDASARRVVAGAQWKVTLRAALGGAGGLVTLGPEALASLVMSVHLAQRLAVVYGFDPGSDAGRRAVDRALAAAFEVELPRWAPSGLRLSDVQLPAARAPRGLIASVLLSRVAVSMGRGLVGPRLVPGLGAALAVPLARVGWAQRGERMITSLRAAAAFPPAEAPVEATVVGPLDRRRPLR